MLARALLGNVPENDAVSFAKQITRDQDRKAVVQALGQTWPVQMAKSVVGAAALPGDVYAGRVDPQSEVGIQRAADLAGFVTLGSFAAPRPAGSLGMGGMPEKPPGIKAYHGSPHDFDKFDLSRIGSGEGHQAYGHGLYFADNEKVAKAYRDQVKDMGAVNDVNRRLSELAKIMSADEAGGYRKYKSDVGRNAAAEYDALMDKRSAVLDAPGHMYEVNIRANPDDFLDWDKPIAQQSEAVRKGFLKAQTGNDPLLAELLDTSPEGLMIQGIMPEAKGAAAYKTMAFDDTDPLAASKRLREAGIPGIKYLDQGSRAAGDGSRNYVVFDDSLIEIIRKYGLLGMMGTGAAAGAYATQAPTQGNGT
jgi:hypothetical protein